MMGLSQNQMTHNGTEADLARSGVERHSKTAKPVRPPGPRGNLLKGNLSQFQRDPLGCMTRWARQHGDVVAIRFVNVRGCILNHPDLVEAVLAKSYTHFKKGRALQMTRRIFGNGLLTSEGNFWLRQRRLVQPAFHKGRIDAYGKVMVDFTTQMLNQWRDGQTLDLHEAMMRLTLRIVAKTLFDTEVAEEANEVADAVHIFMEKFVGLRSLFRRFIPESFPTPGNVRYARSVRNLDTIIYRIIHRRRESGVDAGDLLSMLLAAQDEDGGRMTDEQLRDEVLTLYLAGHETTAVTLTWMLYLLSSHPDVEARLWDELQSVLGGRVPEVHDLRHLVYAERIVKESMRLFPPAYVVGREALTDFKIGGYDIEAGTQVLMSQWVIQRDPRFFPDPDRFNPDRWTEEFSRQLPKYAYFPFGGGPRQCIGNSFAMMEAVLLLGTIAQRFRVAFPAGQTLEPNPTFTLRPKTSPRVELRKR